MHTTTLGIPAAALTLLLLVLPLASGSGACYGMDGTIGTNDMRPCDLSALVSACCSTNKINNLIPDICLSSGLCLAQVEPYTGFVFANGCTDPSGVSDACPHLCPGNLQRTGPSWNVVPCSVENGGTWCCRKAHDPMNCCDNATAVVTSANVGTVLLNVAPATSPASSAASSVTGSGSPTVTATATVTAGTTSAAAAGAGANRSGDNTAVVGGAVGGALGAALLGALGVSVWLCMRRPKKPAADPAGHGNVYGDPNMQTPSIMALPKYAGLHVPSHSPTPPAQPSLGGFYGPGPGGAPSMPPCELRGDQEVQEAPGSDPGL